MDYLIYEHFCHIVYIFISDGDCLLIKTTTPHDPMQLPDVIKHVLLMLIWTKDNTLSCKKNTYGVFRLPFLFC